MFVVLDGGKMGPKVEKCTRNSVKLWMWIKQHGGIKNRKKNLAREIQEIFRKRIFEQSMGKFSENFAG